MNRAAFLRAVLPVVALAPFAAPAVSAELPPGLDGAALLAGETRPDGTRLIALHLDLSQGWKTYWRSPGDTGVPPHFDWTAARNLDAAAPHWPRPEIIDSEGSQTLGYHEELVLPIELTPAAPGAVTGRVAIDFGLCLNICVPAHIELPLPDATAAPDPRVKAALALSPDQGTEAVTCVLTDIKDGVRVAAAVPAANDTAAALELDMDGVWVSQPELSHDGARLTATSDFVGPTGKPFALDPSALRLTLVHADGATEYQGCTPS